MRIRVKDVLEMLAARVPEKEILEDFPYLEPADIDTKDEDFPAREWVSRATPAIVWLRIGNASRRALLGWLEPLLPDIEARLQQGETIIEVR